MKPEFLSITDAAKVAKVDISTLRRWIAAGKVPIYGRRGTYRVMLSDVLPPATSRRSKVYYSSDGRAPVWTTRSLPSKTKVA